MYPYIFIILILLFGAITEVFGKMKHTKLYFVISAILVALFAGLRYNTGADWGAYEPIFYQMPKLGNVINWEVGFYWVSLIFYYVFGNYYVLQFAVSAFLVYSVARFLWKHTDYPIFSLLLFFVMFTINNMLLMALVRQSIAVAIILFGYKYIINKSLGKYIIIVVLACMFHISAIAALPMYFITRKIPNIILIASILFFQIFYFVPEITAYVVKFFLPFMPERLESIGNIYVNSILFADKVQFNTGIYYILKVLLSVIVIYLVDNDSKEKSFLLNSLAISMIIGAISTSMPIIDRFNAYYLIFAIATYPLLFNLKISRIAHSTSSIIIMLLIFCFFYIPFHGRLTSKSGNSSKDYNNNSLNPYYNVISHPKEADFRKDWMQVKNKE